MLYLKKYTLIGLSFITLFSTSLWAEHDTISETIIQAQGSDISVGLNENDIEVRANFNVTPSFIGYSETSYGLHAGYLYSDGDEMISLGLFAKSDFPSIEGLVLSFGMNGVATNDNFLAFPAIANAQYHFPTYQTTIPMTLDFLFAYAPEIISFEDAQHYTEMRLELDMEVIPNIHLLGGYRYIDTEYKTYDKTFNNNIYLGMKLSF